MCYSRGYSVTKYLYETATKCVPQHKHTIIYIQTKKIFVFMQLFTYVQVHGVIPSTQRKREMNQRIYGVVFCENFEKCNRNDFFFEELVQNNLNYFDMCTSLSGVG